MSLEVPKFNKYEVKRENIIPLLELPKNFPSELKALDWPLEIQGSGKLLEDGRNFEVRYPQGDLFYSWATIIHELGHLLQDNLNPEIMEEEDENQRNLLKEGDAFDRGLARFKKYEPESFKKLEDEFIKYKAQNLIPDFASFMELYDNFKQVIKINEILGATDDGSEVKKFKENKIDDFFKTIKKNKVSVTINTNEANDVIFRILKQIAEE